MIDIIADFETAWGSRYSLSKMSYAEYIAHDYFHAWGVGIKIGSSPAKWVHHNIIQQVLDKIWRRFNGEGINLICHNAPFDGSIINWVYGYTPDQYTCTVGLGNALLGEWEDMKKLPGFTDYSLDNEMPKGLRPGMSANYLCYMLGLAGGHKNNSLMHTKDVIPARDGQTLSDEQYQLLAEDCIGDVESIYKLYQYLKQRIPEGANIEEFNHWCVQQTCEPVLELDADLLLMESQALAHENRETLHRICEILDEYHYANGTVQWGTPGPEEYDKARTVLRSPKQFRDVLTMLGVDTSNIKSFAKTDKDFLSLRAGDDPSIRLMVDAKLKLSGSIRDSRVVSYLTCAESMDTFVDSMGKQRFKSKWPVGYTMSGARNTHRLAGTNSGGGNAQNQPKKGFIRKAVTASEDYVLAVGDLSGIELRICMEFCGEREFADLIYSGGDPYVDFAVRDLYPDLYYEPKELWNKRTVEEAHRFNGKTGILQLQYGAGFKKLHSSMTALASALEDAYVEPVDLPEAKRIHSAYWKRFTRIKRKHQILDNGLEALVQGMTKQVECVTFENHGITLPSGLRIRYANIHSKPGKYGPEYYYNDYFKGGQGYWKASTSQFLPQKIYGGKTLENICQALTAEVMRPIVVELSKHWRVPLQVHDEVGVLVPKSDICDAQAIISERLTEGVDWMPKLKLGCSIDYSHRYGDAK